MEPPNDNESPKNETSSFDAVYQFMMFGLSLPERTLRSATAVVCGATSGSAAVLLPRVFHNSKTYQTFVQQMLDMLANNVGGVAQEESAQAAESLNTETGSFVAKKAVSSFVDLAGMATLHVSPMTILAIVSDVAHGSKHYLNEVTAELKREGIVPENSTIGSAAELLDAIGNASSSTADDLNAPPIDLEGLTDTLQRTTEHVAKIDPLKVIPQAEIERLWADMTAMAAQENVSLFSISSAMTMYSLEQVTNVGAGTLSTLRVTGAMLDRHFFAHYREGLEEIQEKGIYSMLSDHSQPYLKAIWFNFASDRPTITEDLLSGRLLSRIFNGMADFLVGTEKNSDPPSAPETRKDDK